MGKSQRLGEKGREGAVESEEERVGGGDEEVGASRPLHLRPPGAEREPARDSGEPEPSLNRGRTTLRGSSSR